MMTRPVLVRSLLLACAPLAAACMAPAMPAAPAAPPVPVRFDGASGADPRADSSAATLPWQTFFADSTLRALIDTAVHNNPEVLATLQEIEIARAEAAAVRGRLRPQARIGATAGLDKSARYTAEGAGNASTDIVEGKEVPEPIGDLGLGVMAAWEVDVRGRIRSQKGAALTRYLASVEASRYVRTSLVAEVANSWYELVALDAKLDIVRASITLQQQALEVVRAQREAAAVTDLAVRQFEALLLNAQGIEVELRQQQRETENRINLLLGRYPQPVPRSAALRSALAGNALAGFASATLTAGLPSQLLQNRPDIRQAEQLLAAARFDVKAARAEFLPEFSLGGGAGVRAYRASLLFTLPESMAWSLAGDLTAPLFNRAGIKAEFARATAAQQQALLGYRRAILTGVGEVSTLASAVENYAGLATVKAQQADALDRAVAVAGDLFTAARANYLEVLTAQREALDVKLEVVETRLRQQVALTSLYRALGGGWR